MTKGTAVVSSACTGCGKVVDMCSSVFGDHKPTSEDITMCFYCGHIMGFTKDIKLRDLSVKEWQDVKKNPQVKHLQQVWSENHEKWHNELKKGQTQS